MTSAQRQSICADIATCTNELIMREATGASEVAILSMYSIINHLNKILYDQNRQNAPK